MREQADFDELYWNLNGNFWDIQTDAFTADIKFPGTLNGNNIDVTYFSGALGAKDDSLSSYEWVDSQTLRVSSNRTMFPGEGLTISATFPKGSMTYYHAGLNDYLPAGWRWISLPLLVLVVCLLVWKKYGDDPDLHRTVIAEYEAPDDLGPMEMGVIKNNGFMDNNFITAAIIQLAADGLLNITETEKTVLLFPVKDYEFSKIDNAEALAKLTPGAKAVYEAVFRGMDTVSLSEMKKEFYKLRPDIEAKTKDWLSEQGYMEKTGFKIQATMFVISIGFLIGVFFVFKDVLSTPMIVALVVSAVIVIFFAAIMAKKTAKGAEIKWKIKGFRLFIDTAEKYRAQFYEKENMFEKILPYAIAFGLTKKWISKMRQMYGEEKFNNIAPLWFMSSTGVFNADSFTSSINSVSTAIATSVSTSSGHGGGGGGGW